MDNIGFIGAGNMAGSLISGLLHADIAADHIRASDPAPANHDLGIHFAHSNQELALWADVLVLAVKPQVLKTVCVEIASAVQGKKPLIVSIAAGIRSEAIDHWLGGAQSIIRIMPNTPALIGLGMSGMYANPACTATHRLTAEQVMQTIGAYIWCADENEIDAVTAVSGSGPAYFFLFIEGLIKAATAQGLPPEAAKKLALQTARGAAQMALESEHDVMELRRRVTSPGGTTERAIQTFNEGQLEQLINKAVDAAAKRSVELSAELGKQT